jgi:hypothetical protein
MAEITPYVCATEPGAFIEASECQHEESRIVAKAYFKKGFDINDLDAATPEGKLAAWETAITSKDVIIVKPVSGSFPDPTENQIKGMGHIENRTSSLSYDVPVEHYGVDANLAFYNAFLGNSKYSVGFVFGDYKMYVALNKEGKFIPMSIFPRPASEETLGEKRRIIVNARWKAASLPYSVDVADVSELFVAEEA